MSTRKSLLFIVALVAMVWADEKPKTTISAWGWLNFGRIGSGFTQRVETGSTASPEKDINFTEMWLEDFTAGIKAERTFPLGLKGRVHFGITTTYIVDNPELLSYEFWQKKWAVFLSDATIEKMITLSDMQSMIIEFGYFPVRYNPEAYNLGEYLFRSTPYPTVIESGFELASSERLTGLHVGHKVDFLDKSFLKTDLYISSNMKVLPLFDISPALTIAANFENIVELGWGMQYYSMFSVDKRQTIPGNDKFRVNLFPHRVVYIDPDVHDTIMITKDTSFYEGETTQVTVPYVVRDTTFYTFRGIKTIGRITLNPRALIPSEALGSEDLKLYAEIGILGLKNYKGWYQNLGERIPIMFGFNIPTFKLLDVLSLQLQYFKNPYWNTWEGEWKLGTPIPYQGKIYPDSYEDYMKLWADSNEVNHKPIHEDDWKWSLYASKKVGKHLRFSLQLACDNLFKSKYMPPPPTQSKYTEVMRDTWMKDPITGKEKWGVIDDWYWMARIMFYL